MNKLPTCINAQSCVVNIRLTVTARPPKLGIFYFKSVSSCGFRYGESVMDFTLAANCVKLYLNISKVIPIRFGNIGKE